MASLLAGLEALSEQWGPIMWRITWQGSLFICVVLLITKVFKRLSPTVKHLLWMLVIAKLLIMPFVVIPVAVSVISDVVQEQIIARPAEPYVRVDADTVAPEVGFPGTAMGLATTEEALAPQGLQSTGNLRYGFSPRMQPLQDTLLKLMSSKAVKLPSALCSKKKPYATHLQNKYYMKFINSFDQLQHGVLSALIAGKSLVYFLESDYCHDIGLGLDKEDARQFVIRREILRSIAAHTCPEIYHLHFNTLAFLLFIVDELQCWGRPTFAKLMEGPRGSKEDEVKIDALSPTHIEICVKAMGNWKKDRREEVHGQLKKIRLRLRLAVDTSKLKTLTFTYRVQSKDKKKHIALTLAGGKTDIIGDIENNDW